MMRKINSLYLSYNLISFLGDDMYSGKKILSRNLNNPNDFTHGMNIILTAEFINTISDDTNTELTNLKKDFKNILDAQYKDIDQLWLENYNLISKARDFYNGERYAAEKKEYLEFLEKNSRNEDKKIVTELLQHKSILSQPKSLKQGKALPLTPPQLEKFKTDVVLIQLDEKLTDIAMRKNVISVARKYPNKPIIIKRGQAFYIYRYSEGKWQEPSKIPVPNRFNELFSRPVKKPIVVKHQDINKSIINDILNLHDNSIQDQIHRSISGVKEFHKYRESTKKHALRDLRYTNYTTKKSKAYKESRSLTFELLLSNLSLNEKLDSTTLAKHIGDTQKIIPKLKNDVSLEQLQLTSLVLLNELTSENMKKSKGTHSRFAKLLSTTIQPTLDNALNELTGKKYDVTIGDIREIHNRDRRIVYAKKLKKYMDTINYTINFNEESPVEYIKNTPRLFKLAMQPKKLDEINHVLESLYNKIIDGNINKSDFLLIKNHYLFMNNPQLKRIVQKLEDNYDENKPTCNFHPDGQSIIAQMKPFDLDEKKNFLIKTFAKSFYYDVLSHGIASRGYFVRNKGKLGQLGDLIGSMDVSGIAPGASLVTGAISAALNQADQERQSTRSSNVTDAIPHDHISVIGYVFAAKIAERFSFQLNSIYHTINYTQAIQSLIEAALKYTSKNLDKVKDELQEVNRKFNRDTKPSSELTQDHINAIADVLLKSMVLSTTQFNLPYPLPSEHLAHKDDVGFFGDKNKQWTIDGVLHKTGLVTVTNGKLEFFNPPGTDPKKYGYAFVDKVEGIYKNVTDQIDDKIKDQYVELFSSKLKNKRTDMPGQPSRL